MLSEGIHVIMFYLFFDSLLYFHLILQLLNYFYVYLYNL